MPATTTAKKRRADADKSYFDFIAERVAEIDALAEAYIATLPESYRSLAADDVATRIWEATFARWSFKECLQETTTAPAWAVTMADWHAVPYCCPPTPGSLYKTLAYSLASDEAHRLHLMEKAEGRLPVDAELPFPVYAEKSVVDKRAGLL